MNTPTVTVLAILLASWSAVPTMAQTLVLDGTSGTNTISSSYETTGGLTIGLGFFAD